MSLRAVKRLCEPGVYTSSYSESIQIRQVVSMAEAADLIAM